MAQERRGEPRVVVNDEFASVDGLLSEYVHDISRTGMFLRCESTLPVGTRVNLCFSILLEDIETIEGLGEVVNHRQGGASGMGIRFIELSPQSRDVIERLLARGR